METEKPSSTSSAIKRQTLKIFIDNDYVVYVEDTPSYDFQSFFGEVGGTLGLLLGISLAHIFDFLDSLWRGFISWIRTKKFAIDLWK